MTREPDHIGETWTVLFVLVMAGNLILALVIAAIWYMSPLGMGFATVHQETWRSDLYWLSWQYGIPVLLIGQGAALHFAFRGQRWRAILVSGGLVVAALLLFALVLRDLG